MEQGARDWLITNDTAFPPLFDLGISRFVHADVNG
jgi:hypothetical protein